MSVQLDIQNQELYALQSIHHLITKHDYQVVKIENHNEDVWLIHPMEYIYPVICVSTLYQGSKIEQLKILNAFKILAKHLHKGARLLLLTTNLTSSTSDYFHCVKIGPNYLSDEYLYQHFPNLATAMKDVSQPLEVVAQLSLSLEEIQFQRMVRFKRLMKQKRYPYITLSVIIICILLFTLFNLLCHYSNESSLWITLLGGGFSPYIHYAYEYLRILTASFIHAHSFTFLLNMMIMYSLGKRLEMLYGSKNFLWLFLLVMISGNITCYCFASEQLFYGLQYGLWGLYGTYLWSVLTQSLWHYKHVRSYFIRLSIMLLLTLSLGYFNYIAMLTSLVMGMLFAFYKEAKKKLYPFLCMTTMIVALFVSMLRLPQPYQDQALHQQMIDLFDDSFLDIYADYLQKQLNN